MNKLDDEIEIKLVEKLMQEDMKWNKSVGSDMWTEHPETRIMKVDMNDFDENSWELLRAELVVAAEKGDMSRVKNCRCTRTGIGRRQRWMSRESSRR